MDPRAALDELDELAADAQQSCELLLEGAKLLDRHDPLIAGAARRVAENRRRESQRIRELRDWLARSWAGVDDGGGS